MQLLERLKESDQDFEWFPSTTEIIDTVAKDMRGVYDEYRYGTSNGSFLDIGAGDGRVLKSIKESLGDYACHIIGELFAIEKSTVHMQNMPKDIVILGTDFMEQTLFDKPMKYIFCNPPYSEYAEWTTKIIREASTSYLYLVVPRRWRDQVEIQQAISARNATVDSLGEFDFENADRKARAKVEVVRLSFNGDKTAAFDAVLEEMLPELEEFDRDESLDDEQSHAVNVDELIKAGSSLIESLVMAYDAEVLSLVENYRAAVKISPKILKELGVSKENILAGIRQKITGLKHKYWKTLFDEFGPVNRRLATKQRKAFLSSLNDKAAIDFTEGNIYSMLIWITKWANDYFDEQLVEFFKTLSTDSNVVKYKSNEKVWTKGSWRYNCGDRDRSHFKLEYRLVINHGGIYVGSYTWNAKHGLTEYAYEFLQDCVTVANNLGFDSDASPGDFEWESNKQNKLLLNNGEVLVAVRAFMNGNLHMHFNPKIMLAINVEAGRLLGWLRSPQEAVDELQAEGAEAAIVHQKFGGSFRISPNNALRITDSRPRPEKEEGEDEVTLSLDHETELGTIRLEKQEPLAPWTITLPCGFQFTCAGRKETAIELAEEVMRESN